MFAKKQTSREAARQTKRDIEHAAKGIDKELTQLQSEEKRLVQEIKAAAKCGNQTAVRLMAKDLVRLRSHMEQMQKGRMQMRSIATRTQVAHSTVAVAGAMKSAGQVMAAANKQMNPAETLSAIQEFQKQSAQVDHADEWMSEFIDDALDTSDTEEEADSLTSQVLDEIGIDTSAKMASAPLAAKRAATQVPVDDEELDTLEQRFAALSK